jgi:hypothetical protein
MSTYATRSNRSRRTEAAIAGHVKGDRLAVAHGLSGPDRATAIRQRGLKDPRKGRGVAGAEACRRQKVAGRPPLASGSDGFDESSVVDPKHVLDWRQPGVGGRHVRGKAAENGQEEVEPLGPQRVLWPEVVLFHPLVVEEHAGSE